MIFYRTMLENIKKANDERDFRHHAGYVNLERI